MNRADIQNAAMLDIVGDHIDINIRSDSGVQAVEQEGERVKNNQDIRIPVVTKPIIHITPRLDQEYYQADVAASSTIIAPSFDAVRGRTKFALRDFIPAVPPIYSLLNYCHPDSSAN